LEGLIDMPILGMTIPFLGMSSAVWMPVKANTDTRQYRKVYSFPSVAPLATITSPLADSMALTTASVEGACTKAADHRSGVGPASNAHQLAFAGQTGEGLIHRSSGCQMQVLFGRQQAALKQGLCSGQDGLSKMTHGQIPFVRIPYPFLTNCKHQVSV